MIIKLLTRMAGPEGNFPSGHILEVTDQKGKSLVKSGYAEIVGAETPVVEEEIEKPIVKKSVKKTSR